MPPEESLLALVDDMISFTHKGNFEKTDAFFKRMQEKQFVRELDRYAKRGVKALSEATPKDTGTTAASWYYDITTTKTCVKIVWKNSNTTDQAPVAILIQYGHATRNGGYVEGIDYINPAIKPIVDELSQYIRKELCAN